MLRIIISSLLLVNAIFWGIYPVSENSPHSFIFKYLGLNAVNDWKIHLLVGIIFYMLSIWIVHIKSIQNYWF